MGARSGRLAEREWKALASVRDTSPLSVELRFGARRRPWEALGDAADRDLVAIDNLDGAMVSMTCSDIADHLETMASSLAVPTLIAAPLAADRYPKWAAPQVDAALSDVADATIVVEDDEPMEYRGWDRLRVNPRSQPTRSDWSRLPGTQSRH